MAFETRQAVATDQYTAIANGKTAVLMQAACEMGALLADPVADRIPATPASAPTVGWLASTRRRPP
ncbi:geranylgeranyl pyrophosphate synthase [Kibdelosporangium phytohabitans]|nr:geranylgeranyl pyrophosphate synthase [Kibdelosporangium phytohabitans]